MPIKNRAVSDEIGKRIRALRQKMGFSMRECASRAGIAVSFLSKVEAGKASPTLMTMQKILEALEMDLGAFFGDRVGRDPRPLVFPHRAMKLAQDHDRTWCFAFPRRSDIKLTLTHEEYRPQTRVVECEHHLMDLAGLVLEGELTLEIPGEAIHRVRKNDAFYLPAGQKHMVRNEGRRPLKMVAVQLRP